MPTRDKESVESNGKSSPGQAGQKQPEPPDKAAGPMRLFRSPADSQPPPDHKAAELITSPRGSVGTVSRARIMRSMQQSVGNARVSTLLGGAIQTRLTVGAVDDPHELEADRVAEQITQQPSNPKSPVQQQIVMQHSLTHLANPQRQGKKEEKPQEDAAAPQISSLPAETLSPATGKDEKPVDQLASPGTSTISTLPSQSSSQPKAEDAGAVQRAGSGQAGQGTVGASMEGRIRAPTGGQPLPEGLQHEMELGLGADFSQVRIHDSTTDQADAERLNAKAFTHGEHIWLGAGESANDRKLMAHELTHVVQQGGGETQRKPVEEAEINEPTRKEEAPGTLLQAAPAVPGNLDAGHNAPESLGEASSFEQVAASPRLGGDVSVSPAVASEHEPQSARANERDATPLQSAGPATASNVIAASPSASFVLSQPSAGAAAAPGRVGTEASSGAPPAMAVANLAQVPASEMGPPDSSAAPPIPPPPPTAFGDAAGGAVAAPFAAPGAEAMDVGTREAISGLEPSLDAEPLQLESTSPGGESSTTEVARMPAAPAASSMLGDTGPGFVQRQESDEDEGVIAGLRRRLRSVIDGMSSGWTSLTQMVVGAYETIRAQVGGLLESLQSVITAALTTLQNAWSGLVARVQQLADGIKKQVQAAVDAVVGAAQAIGRAVIRLDPLGLRTAWSQLTGILSGINQRIQQALQSVFNTINGLWQGLRGQFDAIVNRLVSGATAIQTQAQAMVQGLRQRVTSMWQSLSARATQLSALIAELNDSLRWLLSSLISWAYSIWARVQQGFDALISGLSAFVQQVLQGVTRAFQALQQRAAAFWRQLQNLWDRLMQSVRQILQRLVDGLRAVWNKIKALGIEALIRTIEAIKQIYEGMKQLYEDVRGFFNPIAAAITDMVYGQMPDKAHGFAEQQMGQALGGPAAATPDQAPESEETAVETQVQRVPRSTATISEIWTGFKTAITTMWAHISWKAIFDMVLDALLEQLFPPLAVYRQVRDFIFQDMAALVRGLFMPRNIFSDPIGALHDIYTNLYHLIVDFVLSLLRRLLNILMAFMLWITIILTVLGAIGGSVVVGILGTILAGLATLGIGAGAGAAGGAAAGGAAGAGVGFGVALLIGEAMFFAYLGIQGATIIATVLDLNTTRQSDEEKQRDYAQLAESAIAVGVGLALLLLAWLAGTIAKAVAALIERLGIKIRLPIPPALSRFLRGVGSTRRPPRGGLTPAEVAARLAAEQRLSRIIGGDLARLFVAELGPELAEAVVARLGAANIRRLATELSPRAIAEIAAALGGDVVERLLNGGMTPGRINAGVVAGQADRLAALTAEQIRRLSGLSDNGFNRMIRLPEGGFRRFINLGEAQFRAFAEMEDGAFARFVTLDDAIFARFATMTPEQLAAFAGMTDDAFNRFTAMNSTTFAKLSNLSPQALARWGTFDNVAFADVEAMLGNTKVTDAAQLDGLLTNTKVRDAAQLRGLLENNKIRDASQLETLLADPKIATAAELEGLLGNVKVVDAAELEQLLARYQSATQLEQLLAAPTVTSGADLVRLADVMTQAGIPNATTGGIADEALARFCRPDILAELEQAANLQSAGRLEGVDQWIRFAENKSLDDLTRSAGELREARRLANENPGTVIDVAGDVNAPPRPGRPGETMQSFDMTIKDSSGNVVRSIEVTSIDNPVTAVGDITPGVRHASDKAASRIAEGNPIQGSLEVTIRMSLDIGETRQGGVIRQINPDGTVNLLRPDTRDVVRTSNIFNDFAGNASTVGNNQLLDVITLVDPNTGAVVAQYNRVGGGWVRVR